MNSNQENQLLYVTTLDVVNALNRHDTMNGIHLPTCPNYSYGPQNTNRMTLPRPESRYLNLVRTRKNHDFELGVGIEPALDGGVAVEVLT